MKNFGITLLVLIYLRDNLVKYLAIPLWGRGYKARGRKIIPAFCNRYLKMCDSPGKFCMIQQAAFGG
jgi:hypothetical protein